MKGYREEKRMRGRRQERSEEEETDNRRRQVVKLLAKGQISRAVRMINSHGVANIEDPLIMDQLRAKYPDRTSPLPPARITKAEPVLPLLRGIRESFKTQDKAVAPGTGGLRTEYLVVLGETMDGTQIALMEEFGLRYLGGALAPMVLLGLADSLYYCPLQEQ